MGYMLSFGFYAAFLFFVAGYLNRMLTWARQAPPRTFTGGKISLPVFLKALGDIFLLRRLLRVNDILWLGEWVFHASLLVLFLRHLRYFLDPAPAFVAFMQIPAVVAAWLLFASLLYIGLMKLCIEKRAYISSYNFFLLGLITASCVSGLLMRYSFPADLADIKRFTLGIATFRPVPLSGGITFLLHFLIFLVLLAGLPGHIFAAPLTMIEARGRDEELPYLMHEK